MPDPIQQSSPGAERPAEARPLPSRHRLASLIVLALDMLLLLSLLYACTVTIGRFAQLFGDLKMELPILTHLVISIPRTAAGGVLLGIMAALMYKELRIADKTRTLIMNLVVFVVGACAGMFLVIVLFCPLLAIIDSLNK